MNLLGARSRSLIPVIKNNFLGRHANKLFSIFALLWSGSSFIRGQAVVDGGGGAGADGAAVQSDKGYSPNATISTVSGISIDQYKMNLLFSVPITPTFRVGAMSYGVTAHYNSNIESHLSPYAFNPAGYSSSDYIATIKSPFGVGFEPAPFGLITLDWHPGDSVPDAGQLNWHRSWVYRGGDGATHELFMLVTPSTLPPPGTIPQGDNTPHYGGGEPLFMHLRGDQYIIQNGSGAWVEYLHPDLDFYTADGSLIRGRVHVNPDGTPAWWELFLPSGQHMEFRQQFTPPGGKSLQDSINLGCTAPDFTNAYPQEMVGFYPTRVESYSRMGYNLDYDPDYGYLITRIHDDTSRRVASSPDAADVIFNYQIIGGAPRYTAISYPGSNGARQTVALSYYAPQPLKLRQYDQYLFYPGNPAVQATLLKEVKLPGPGYVQRFAYFGENPDPAVNEIQAGRVKDIFLPTGGVHHFSYAAYRFLSETRFNSAPTDDPSVGIVSHVLETRSGVTDADPADRMKWQYSQEAAPLGCSPYPPICKFDTRNIVTDPAGNSVIYLFRGKYKIPTSSGNPFGGLLFETHFLSGTYGAGGIEKKVVINNWTSRSDLYPSGHNWGMSSTLMPQLVSTLTQLKDDPDRPDIDKTILEENLGFDGWGHFTIKRTSGTLIPKARQTVTTYSIDRMQIAMSVFPSDEPFAPGNGGGNPDVSPLSTAQGGDRVPPTLPGDCKMAAGHNGPMWTMPRAAHATVASCSYLSDLIDRAAGHWFPSLPLSVEVQEETLPGSGAFVTKSRVEHRYDPATGLLVRSVARKDPAASALSDECTATLSPAPGDVVSDFYYDDRGDLALKKIHGGDDNSAFRNYTGTGDKPAAADAPGITPTTGPDGRETIYPNPGNYYGFARWSRERAPGEAPAHRFLDSFLDDTDIEPASGAITRSRDANDLRSRHAYDAMGRITKNQFFGDMNHDLANTPTDQPVRYSYLDFTQTLLGQTFDLQTRLVGLQTVQEDPARPEQRTETQDYFDGLGRKIISRRRNPDGQFAFQAMHYDEIGHVNLLSNWSFILPPGLDAAGVYDPAQWTETNLAAYILGTVGSYTRSCYRTFAAGANGGACESAADGNGHFAPNSAYEFAGRVRRVERIGRTQGLLSAVDTEYFGLNVRTRVNGVKTGPSTTENAVTVHYQDGFGNLRVVDADENGAGGGQGADAIYDYDYANHLVKVNLVPQVTFASTGSDRYATTNGDSQTRFFSFDALGRQTTAQNQENGLTKSLSFNAMGQVLEAEDENGRTNGYHLIHRYDDRGRVIAIGRRATPVGPFVPLRMFDFEAKKSGADCTASRSCGELVHAVSLGQNSNDVHHGFAFRPADGRLASQDLVAPSINRPTNVLSFDYDSFGRQNLATYPDGRLISLDFQYGGVRAVNRLNGSTVIPYATLANPGDYFADGDLAHFRQGNRVDYSRQEDEAERRLKSILSTRDTCPPNGPAAAAPPPCTAPVLTVWESGLFQYDFAGNIIAIGQDAFTYDRLSRLKSATVNRHPHTTFQGGIQPAGFVTLNYGYDLFGNITDRQLAANRNYTVGSDSALELFAGRSYAQSVTAVPDNKIHQAGFRYDGNGNLISDGKKDFIYDELNQQVEVREVTTSCAAAGQGTGSFDSQANAGEGAGATPHRTLCYGKGSLIESNLYGPDGMRATRHVEKVAGGVRVATDSVYVRLGGNVVKEYTEELRAPTSAAPELSHEKAYIYGPLGLLATEELCSFNCKSDESAGIPTTRYYEYDHLGTIRAISDAGGKLESTFDYEPFGLELKSVGIDWWTDVSSNTHRFTGHERDEEAGEDYMKARMYVLSTARFPQIDPQFDGAGDPQNWNAYIYVRNSPVGASDPTGMKIKIENVKDTKSKNPNTKKSYDNAVKKLKEIAKSVGLDASIKGKKLEISPIKGFDTSKLTSVQKGFSDFLTKMASDTKTTSITISSNSDKTVVGNYQTGDIDLSDVSQLGSTNEGVNQYSALAHELTEQDYKQNTLGKAFNEPGQEGFKEAHEAGIAKEKEITGSERINDSNDMLRSKTGTITFEYKNGDKKITDKISVIFGDVIGVQETKEPLEKK